MEYGMDVTLTLKESQLEEITKTISNRTVGRVMKRFELGGDLASIKANVKELLHESFADYEDLIFAKGVTHITKFDFQQKDILPK